MPRAPHAPGTSRATGTGSSRAMIRSSSRGADTDSRGRGSPSTRPKGRSSSVAARSSSPGCRGRGDRCAPPRARGARGPARRSAPRAGAGRRGRGAVRVPEAAGDLQRQEAGDAHARRRDAHVPPDRRADGRGRADRHRRLHGRRPLRPRGADRHLRAGHLRQRGRAGGVRGEPRPEGRRLGCARDAARLRPQVRRGEARGRDHHAARRRDRAAPARARAAAQGAEAMTPLVLRAEGLVKSYRGRRVVDGVSLHVGPGEVVGLLGPNGAGKTTSFNMVVGLVAPEAGKELLGETDLTRLPMHRRARLGVGYLPQEASIFRRLTVRQNFTGVLEALGVARRERDERADALLAEFRLEKVAESLGEQLSGGERRRAEVARSLLSSPRYILFDEPFAGVDPIAVGELQRLIGSLRDRGIGVLITDHAVREALGICGRAYILSAGAILEAGTPAEIAASPKARAVYLGEKFRLDEQAVN